MQQISTFQQPLTQQLPPQAHGWPLRGPIPTLDTDLFGFLKTAQAKYGDIYTLNLGLTKVIILLVHLDFDQLMKQLLKMVVLY